MEFIADKIEISQDDLYYDVKESINEGDYIENYNDLLILLKNDDKTLKSFFLQNEYEEKQADYYAKIYENQCINQYSLDEKTLSIITEYENFLKTERK